MRIIGDYSMQGIMYGIAKPDVFMLNFPEPTSLMLHAPCFHNRNYNNNENKSNSHNDDNNNDMDWHYTWATRG